VLVLLDVNVDADVKRIYGARRSLI